MYDLQNLKTRRITAGVNATYELNDNINFLLGGTYYNDYMRYYRPFLILNTGNAFEYYHAAAGFGEFSLRTRFFNLFAGGRLDVYNAHNLFEPNFAPRISITKEFKSFHYKLIYGESFKIPTLQNINLAFNNPEPIKPEKIKDYQLELGTKFKTSTVNAGLFYTSIDDIIVYGYDLANNLESYMNSGNITFAGAELYTTHTFSKLNLKAGYSYYELLKADGTDFVADTTTLSAGTLGIPKHKFTLRGSYNLNDKHRFILSYIFQSEKISVEQTNSFTEEYNFITRPSTNLIDFTYQWNNIFGFLDFSAGARNLLNIKNHYVYPMSGGYPTSMGMGLELFAVVKIRL